MAKLPEGITELLLHEKLPVPLVIKFIFNKSSNLMLQKVIMCVCVCFTDKVWECNCFFCNKCD